MNKPKLESQEYWICDHGQWYEDKQLAFEEQSRGALTHVIEYSVYAALKKQLDNIKTSMRSWEVAREIEILANSEHSWNELKEENADLKKQLETLQKENKRLRKALEDIIKEAGRDLQGYWHDIAEEALKAVSEGEGA